jgi:hypothetical protein
LATYEFLIESKILHACRGEFSGFLADAQVEVGDFKKLVCPTDQET